MPNSQIEIFFDGACEPRNPGGAMGFGAYATIDGVNVWSVSKQIPAAPYNSNNVAEYMALESALDWLLETDATEREIIVHGDSRLVIEQCFGRWKIGRGFYVEIANRVIEKLERFKSIRGHWIPRDKNNVADNLSKAALEAAGITITVRR